MAALAVAVELLAAEVDAGAVALEPEPALGLAFADGSDEGFGAGVGGAGADVVGAVPFGEVEGEVEQHDFPCAGAGVLGAETPAMPDPRPSFCRLVASNFPLGSRPFAD